MVLGRRIDEAQIALESMEGGLLEGGPGREDDDEDDDEDEDDEEGCRAEKGCTRLKEIALKVMNMMKDIYGVQRFSL